MPNTTDTVKAILTPGEFVIRKEAVDMIGVPTLEKLNDMPEAGGHSEIDRLIAQATLKNMTGMYGGGMVNAEQYGHGGMVNKYEDGGQAMSNLKPVPDNNPGLAKLPEGVRNKMGYMQNGGLMEMMHGGKAKKKKEMYSYEDGGQALSQEQIEALMPEQDFKDRMIPLGLRDSRRVTDFIDPNAQFDKFKNIDSGMSPTQDDEGIEILANMLLKDAEKKEYSQLYNYELPTMQVTDSQRYKAIMDLFKDMGGNKRNLLGMQEGGQAYSQTLYNTPLENSFAQASEPGLFDVGSILSVSADQVGGEGGRRYYLGEGQSKMLNMARKKASMRARQKMASAPQDSIPAALVESYFEQAPEKEKGGFLKKLLGMQDGGAVQDSAMMQQEQPSPFVPFDQRPNQAPATGNWGQSGDYMNSLRGELEMENEELTRDKMQNFLERLRLDSLSEKLKLDSLSERIERSPQDSMYYRNTPQQDYFMDKYREEMINPNYFPEGN